MLAGAEQHPPFFFLSTRAFAALLGYGRIALRLPEILGFWIMSLTLFFFVRRRSSAAYGLVAMLFPLVTGAYYYAYEARPYGLVLAFSGLALLCWQSAAEGRLRPLALVGLCLSLAAAVSCHYYAVLCFIPIGVGELVRTVSKRRLDIWIWIALVAALFPLLLFLPLIRAGLGYSSHFWAKPTWGTPVGFFDRLLSPASLLLFALPLIVALETLQVGVGRENPERGTRNISLYELAAAGGFFLLPLFGLFLAKFVTGAFTDRYAMSAVVGVSILLTLSLSAISRKHAGVGSFVALLLAVFFVLNAAKTYGELAGEALAQNRTYHFLQTQNNALPLIVDGPHLFFALSYIAAEQADRRTNLIYLTDVALATKYTQTDDVERGLAQLKRIAPLDVRDFRRFCATHSAFLIYGSSEPFTWIIQELGKEGWSFSVKARNGGHFLFLASRSN